MTLPFIASPVVVIQTAQGQTTSYISITDTMQAITPFLLQCDGLPVTRQCPTHQTQVG